MTQIHLQPAEAELLAELVQRQLQLQVDHLHHQVQSLPEGQTDWADTADRVTVLAQVARKLRGQR